MSYINGIVREQETTLNLLILNELFSPKQGAFANIWTFAMDCDYRRLSTTKHSHSKVFLNIELMSADVIHNTNSLSAAMIVTGYIVVNVALYL